MQELLDRLEAAGFTVKESNPMPNEEFVIWYVAREDPETQDVHEAYIRSDDVDAVENLVNPPNFDHEI